MVESKMKMIHVSLRNETEQELLDILYKKIELSKYMKCNNSDESEWMLIIIK